MSAKTATQQRCCPSKPCTATCPYCSGCVRHSGSKQTPLAGQGHQSSLWHGKPSPPERGQEGGISGRGASVMGTTRSMYCNTCRHFLLARNRCVGVGGGRGHRVATRWKTHQAAVRMLRQSAACAALHGMHNRGTRGPMHRGCRHTSCLAGAAGAACTGSVPSRAERCGWSVKHAPDATSYE